MVIFGRRKVEETGSNVKCPFCAEFIKVDAIKCKHCGSDVQPTFAEKEIKDFNPSEMEIRSFYINRKNGIEINRVALGDLVDKLKNTNPSMSNEDIEKKYQQQVVYLQRQIPKKIREDFLKTYKSILLET
ncbi:hypothetical protein WB66_05375 [bacteria symbiont BFo1 of Frankliniella occidentalis]|nr:hypothetical protein WB66_05375 [bacteria symbiont BFo1 of Frankliniella occidentalis]